MLAAPDDPFEQHFDFGTSTSPVAPGFVQITPAARYSEATGYGWSVGSIQDRDRGATYGDARVRDFNFSSQATFAVDVPTGVYEVTVTLGDGLAVRDEMGVFLETVHVDTITAAAGQYETRTFTVTVTDGQLTLMLQDLGGANNLVMINSLDVVQVGGDPSGPHVVSASPAGEVFDTLQQFTVIFNEEIDVDTLSTDQVTLSGPDGVIGPTAITRFDGVTFEIEFATQTALGAYTLQIGPGIADQDGVLMNQDGDDINGEAGEDAYSLTLTLSRTPAFLQTYDFGTTSSPVAAGTHQVSEGTVYSTANGFGWTDGTIDSRDRGVSAGNELTRDFNVTTAGTFVVDVLDEEAIYDVTIVLGDPLAARDEMGLFLEGTQVDSVSTAVGSYETRTFRVTVSDGQLTLRLEDLGGADTVAVINSLQIRHVETVVPPDDGGDGGDGDDDDGMECDRERGGKRWKWAFRHAFRKLRKHCLPAVASAVAFDPPGHGDESHERGWSSRRPHR